MPKLKKHAGRPNTSPAPVVEPRRRRLGQGGRASKNATWLNSCSSPFLRLPRELRDIVYSYVYVAECTTYTAGGDEDIRLLERMEGWYKYYGYPINNQITCSNQNLWITDPLLPLLRLACKQVNKELREFLLSKTFVLAFNPNHKVSEPFFEFPYLYSSVRHIRIEFQFFLLEDDHDMDDQRAYEMYIRMMLDNCVAQLQSMKCLKTLQIVGTLSKKYGGKDHSIAQQAAREFHIDSFKHCSQQLTDMNSVLARLQVKPTWGPTEEQLRLHDYYGQACILPADLEKLWNTNSANPESEIHESSFLLRAEFSRWAGSGNKWAQYLVGW